MVFPVVRPPFSDTPIKNGTIQQNCFCLQIYVLAGTSSIEWPKEYIALEIDKMF
jgi:hypothetical protein